MRGFEELKSVGTIKVREREVLWVEISAGVRAKRDGALESEVTYWSVPGPRDTEQGGGEKVSPSSQ